MLDLVSLHDKNHRRSGLQGPLIGEKRHSFHRRIRRPIHWRLLFFETCPFGYVLVFLQGKFTCGFKGYQDKSHHFGLLWGRGGKNPYQSARGLALRGVENHTNVQQPTVTLPDVCGTGGGRRRIWIAPGWRFGGEAGASKSGTFSRAVISEHVFGQKLLVRSLFLN